MPDEASEHKGNEERAAFAAKLAAAPPFDPKMPNAWTLHNSLQEARWDGQELAGKAREAAKAEAADQQRTATAWARLMQARIWELNGKTGPFEVVRDSAEETLLEANQGQQPTDELRAALVRQLHLTWVFGDLLLSWHNAVYGEKSRTQPKTCSTEAPPKLARRKPQQS